MPLTEEDLKQIDGLMEKRTAPLTEKVGKLESEFPGMSKRHASDAIAGLTKTIDELKATHKPAEGKPAEKPNTDERTAKLEAELTAIKTRAERSEIQAEVQAGLSKVPLVDGVSQDYLEILTGKVKRKEDGKLYMLSSRKLEATGQEVTDEVTVDIGIQNFFSGKPALKKSNAAGGVGAQGSGGSTGGPGISSTATYADLLKDPAMMGKMLKENPQRVGELRAENDRKRSEKMGAR